MFVFAIIKENSMHLIHYILNIICVFWSNVGVEHDTRMIREQASAS